jgi:hypothetical protein
LFLQVGGQQAERETAGSTKHMKVALVQGEDVPGGVSFSEHHVRGICQTNVAEAGIPSIISIAFATSSVENDSR